MSALKTGTQQIHTSSPGFKQICSDPEQILIRPHSGFLASPRLELFLQLFDPRDAHPGEATSQPLLDLGWSLPLFNEGVNQSRCSGSLFWALLPKTPEPNATFHRVISMLGRVCCPLSAVSGDTRNPPTEPTSTEGTNIETFPGLATPKQASEHESFLRHLTSSSAAEARRGRGERCGAASSSGVRRPSERVPTSGKVGSTRDALRASKNRRAEGVQS